MDFDSSSKFISSLAKFLQSLCNGYIDFNNGVEVIGHIYLNVDTGKKIDYILNEKICKTNEHSVSFVSNSFHAQPAQDPKVEKEKPPAVHEPVASNKDTEIILMDDDDNDYQTYNKHQFNGGQGTVPTFSQKQPRQRQTASKRSHGQTHSSNHLSPAKAAKFTSASLNSNKSIPPPQNDTSFNLSHDTNLSASSQVFSESRNPPSAGETDVKPVLDKDMNVISIKEEMGESSLEIHGGGDNYGGHQQQDASYYSEDQSYEIDPNDEYYQDDSQDTGYDPAMYGESSQLGESQVVEFKYRVGHMCDYCGKRFVDTRSLTDHRNSVHLLLFPYSCPTCDKTFVYKRNQKRHSLKCFAAVIKKIEG